MHAHCSHRRATRPRQSSQPRSALHPVRGIYIPARSREFHPRIITPSQKLSQGMKRWSRSTQNYSTPSRLRCINAHARRLETALRGSPSQRHQVPRTRYGQPAAISPMRQCYIPIFNLVSNHCDHSGNLEPFPEHPDIQQRACHQQNPDDNANLMKLFGPTKGNTSSWVESQTASVFRVPLNGVRYIQAHNVQTYASRKFDSLAKCKTAYLRAVELTWTVSSFEVRQNAVALQ